MSHLSSAGQIKRGAVSGVGGSSSLVPRAEYLTIRRSAGDNRHGSGPADGDSCCDQDHEYNLSQYKALICIYIQGQAGSPVQTRAPGPRHS